MLDQSTQITDLKQFSLEASENVVSTTASGEHTRPRVWEFGVPPNMVFRRDAGKRTRGRVRSPERSYLSR